MRRINGCVIAFLLAGPAVQAHQVLPTPAAPAMVPVLRKDSPPPVILEEAVPGSVPQPPTEGAKPKDDKPKEDPRLKKIAQVQYDRRPSAILKAWSEPLPRMEGDVAGPPAPTEND